MNPIRAIAIPVLVLLLSGYCPDVNARSNDQDIDSLIVQLKSAGRNWNTIADQLIEIGEPAVLPLIGVLQDTTLSQWTRRITAMTLNDIHSPTYVEPALQLLLDRDENTGLRNQVTNGLKGYDVSHASEELWQIYHEEENDFFRLNIAAILITSDPNLAYQAYEELYVSSDGYCRQQSLKNMILLKPHRSIDLYVEALQTDDWMTANLAMDSLVRMENFSSGRIIRLFHKPDTPEIVRWRIVHVLRLRPEKNHLDLHVGALSDPGWLVQNEAALALTGLPADKVLPEMRYLEQSDDHGLVRLAGWVISQFKEEPSEELAAMQPYDGYPWLDNKRDIENLLMDKCVDTISFRKGEVVADIGAGNGYLEAMLSMVHEDLTFYIQDINPEVCNPNSVQEVIDFYEDINGRPFTSRFTVVNGTDDHTNLPEQYFDKILMLWTFQYLKHPCEFMTVVRNNLKKDGLLYVINPDLDREYGKLLSVEFGWNGSTIDREIADIIQCGFELVSLARNYDSIEQPYIMVFRKK